MSDNNVTFGTLHEDGSFTDERVIKQSSIRACPHFIMVPEHYREDGTCRCDDVLHHEMDEWGYAWRDGRWVGDEQEG